MSGNASFWAVYAHFQQNFTRMYANSFGDNFWLISACSEELWDALGQLLIDLGFNLFFLDSELFFNLFLRIYAYTNVR